MNSAVKKNLLESCKLSQGLFDLGMEWECPTLELMMQALNQNLIDSVKFKKKEQVGRSELSHVSGRGIVRNVRAQVGKLYSHRRVHAATTPYPPHQHGLVDYFLVEDVMVFSYSF